MFRIKIHPLIGIFLISWAAWAYCPGFVTRPRWTISIK